MNITRTLLVAALCSGLVFGCKKGEPDTTLDNNAAAQEQEEQKNDADDEQKADADEQKAADDPKPSNDGDNALNSEDPKEILAGIPGEGNLHAVIVTSKGDIDCTLTEDKTPITVANFVGLATGKKNFRDPSDNSVKKGNFYDGVIFHRVIPGFMIQGGDPLGQGIGGPGYKFEDEFDSSLVHDKAGTLSMANSGPNTNGSQFFITDAPTPHLNGRHSVFGYCQNTDVISAIANVERDRADRPTEDVTIKEIKVERR